MKLKAIDIFAIILSILVFCGFSISAYAGKETARDVVSKPREHYGSTR